MKRVILTLLGIYLLTSCVSNNSPVQSVSRRGSTAGSSLTSKDKWYQIKPEVSLIRYKEPGVMKETGMMWGINGTFTSSAEMIDLKAEVHLSYGYVNYDGAYGDGTSLTVNNVPDDMMEIRLLFYKKKLVESNTMDSGIYLGYGHRYLYDGLSKHSAGYTRESRYDYIPMGMKIGVVTIEYDLFMEGKQKSHLSVLPGYPNVTNTQEQGYGLRANFEFDKVDLFIRYWSIGDSDIVYYDYYGTPAGGMEPKNTSVEIGISWTWDF